MWWCNDGGVLVVWCRAACLGYVGVWCCNDDGVGTGVVYVTVAEWECGVFTVVILPGVVRVCCGVCGGG